MNIFSLVASLFLTFNPQVNQPLSRIELNGTNLQFNIDKETNLNLEYNHAYKEVCFSITFHRR